MSMDVDDHTGVNAFGNVGSEGEKYEFRNPVGVETDFSIITQGSSCLATLGFVAESLWDS